MLLLIPAPIVGWFRVKGCLHGQETSMGPGADLVSFAGSDFDNELCTARPTGFSTKPINLPGPPKWPFNGALMVPNSRYLGYISI